MSDEKIIDISDEQNEVGEQEEEEWRPDFVMLFNHMVSATVKYDNGPWDQDEFEDHFLTILDEVRRQLGDFNPHDKSRRDLLELGFIPWDKEFLLMPSWIIDLIDDGVELTKIDPDESDNRETVVVGEDDVDEEFRWGLSPYGVNKPEGDSE